MVWMQLVRLQMLTILGAGLVLQMSCIQRGMRTFDSRFSEDNAGSPSFNSSELTIFDMQQVARNLQSSRSTGAEISMDEYLGALKAHPKGFPLFANFTAAFSSTAQQAASKEFPRIIMTTESGSLTITFNSGNLAGNHQLEINQVNPLTSERVLYSMDFPLIAGQAFAELEKNPTDCMGCHVTSNIGVKHLWGRYPKWQGVIGGEDDFIAPTVGRYVRNIEGCEPDPTKVETSTQDIVEEYEILQHLRSLTTKGAPRYRHLTFPADSPLTYPYSSDPKGYIANRPNFRFGALWHRHHIAHLLYQTKQAKKYDEFSKLHLYGFFGCSALVESAEDQKVRKRYQVSATGDDGNTEFMARALGLMGYELYDLSLNEQPANFEHRKGYSPGSENSILLMARWILEDDKKNHQRLPHSSYYLEPPKECAAIYDTEKFPSLDQFGHKPTLRIAADGNPDPSMCRSLAQEILAN